MDSPSHIHSLLQQLLRSQETTINALSSFNHELSSFNHELSTLNNNLTPPLTHTNTSPRRSYTTINHHIPPTSGTLNPESQIFPLSMGFTTTNMGHTHSPPLLTRHHLTMDPKNILQRRWCIPISPSVSLSSAPQTTPPPIAPPYTLASSLSPKPPPSISMSLLPLPTKPPDLVNSDAVLAPSSTMCIPSEPQDSDCAGIT